MSLDAIGSNYELVEDMVKRSHPSLGTY